MVISMQNIILRQIEKQFENNTDFVIKKIKINYRTTLYVLYLESVTGSDKVNDYILKNITLLTALKKKSFKDIQSLIPAPHTLILNKIDEIEFYITNGFTIVIKGNEILALETKADITRGIPEAKTEQDVFGPKDAFTENIQINLGLVKRRIKSSTLKALNVVIGRKTNTTLNILYFDDIVKKDSLDKIYKQLKKIDIDGIIDSGVIAEYLEEENKTNFPTVIKTERPDYVSSALMAGKIVILIDTSPFALILPAFFGDFINPVSDDYRKTNNINFLKVLRFMCFFITMMAPGLYIALINYNPETIPSSLLINFSAQRNNVPFPTLVEAILMLFIYEILRESDLRFPNTYGSAISILGALILGEAAVSAGFVSPIMIIVIAFTFITSLIFTEIELVDAARYFRIIFLFAAALYGLYGIVLAFIYFLIHVIEIKTLDEPYFYPLAPFDFKYLMQGLLKNNFSKNTERSPLLTEQNFTKQRRIDK